MKNKSFGFVWSRDGSERVGRGGTRCGALAQRWGIGCEVERDAELLCGDSVKLSARYRDDKNCQFWAETD